MISGNNVVCNFRVKLVLSEVVHDVVLRFSLAKKSTINKVSLMNN